MPQAYLTAILSLTLLLSACKTPVPSHIAAANLASVPTETAPDSTAALGEDADIKPCRSPEYWPHALRSTKVPVLVHYRLRSEAAMARQVLEYVERGWEFHVNKIGFIPPLDDHGACGSDGAFDVFLWRGHRSCLVDILDENPATTWDDRTSFAIIDPYGPYGGPELESTVTHEFGHGSQAAYDWSGVPIVYEMTALFLDQTYADSYIKKYLNDFQTHPDWAMDYDDGYETWYFYGASLYLMFLRDRYFDGDPRFVVKMWEKSRHKKPADGAPHAESHPTYEDALDELLKERGGPTYLATIPEFARWRWYTGDHVDDKHFRPFKDGLEHLKAAKLSVIKTIKVKPSDTKISSGPMLTGTVYVDLVGGKSGEEIKVEIVAPATGQVQFVVQALPGLTAKSDGDSLGADGSQKLKLGPDGRRTLAITAMPVGAYDVHTRTNARYPLRVVLSK